MQVSNQDVINPAHSDVVTLGDLVLCSCGPRVLRRQGEIRKQRKLQGADYLHHNPAAKPAR